MSLIHAILGRARRQHIDPLAHAETLRPHFHAMGANCAISPRAVITDPAYCTLGDNVRLSDCFIFGHDGSINMVNRALGKRFDAVGPVTIGNDVFVGHHAIILMDTSIGDRVIIGAGSVVKGRIEGNSVFAGNPARKIMSFDEYAARRAALDAAYPWRDLIASRATEFDPALEPELVERRVAHFFGERP